METAIIERLVQLAHTAPSADNSQPWRLHWDGSSLNIGYDSSRVSGKTFPAESPATLLSIGAIVEIIMTVADDWGLAPNLAWLAPLPDPGTAQYARITFQRLDQSTPGDTSHPVSSRHTNRFTYSPQPIPEELSRKLESMTEEGARILVLDRPEGIKQVANIVTSASEIRFQTREVHEWLGKSLRFSAGDAAQGDGMDVATLGLPPGGKLFLRLISSWQRMRWLNKLGVYKLVSAIDTAPIKKARTLVAIIAPESPLATANAGRLMARAWIELNFQGISAHPYYVIADQLARLRAGSIPGELLAQASSVQASSKEAFGLRDSETLHMLFRVGFARKAPKLSQRLPLDCVYHKKSHP